MSIDIIEIRVCNYFEYNRQVKQITAPDLVNMNVLLPQLQPIAILPARLFRLNFTVVSAGDRNFFQRFARDIYFNFYRTKDKLQLVINDQIRLPHIVYIHQLQNIYYDLTGDVLAIPSPTSKQGEEPIAKHADPSPYTIAKVPVIPILGKYRQ